MLVRCVRISAFMLVALGTARAEEERSNAVPRTWAVTLQGGLANTFQLNLGGYFGEGPYFQNRLAVNLNNLYKDGDSLSVSGWSTTDLPASSANWQAALMYKNRILRTRRHALSLGGGIQRWLYPSVRSGIEDWLAVGTLNYNTTVRGLPLTVSQESFSLLRSSQPRGSLLLTQTSTQHVLFKHEGFQLLLRHGPQHTYSWGFWGGNGNRVVRYGGSLVAAWKNTTLEFGCRQQFGLQDGIPYNRYWSFQFARQMGGPLHSR